MSNNDAKSKCNWCGKKYNESWFSPNNYCCKACEHEAHNAGDYKAPLMFRKN